jgi:hypothetical protein
VTQVLQHTFRPRGAALEAMRYRGAEVLMAGPAGTGKSRAMLEKGHMVNLLTSGTKGLLLRKKAVDLATSGIKTFEQYVATQALLDGTVNYFGGSQREAPQYRYSNGSSITVGGLDNPMKVMSAEYDWIVAMEATEFTPEDWQACITRLRNGVLSFQQLMADCNPQHPTHWLKLRCESGKTLMLHSRHEDNPRYFNADGTKTPEGEQYMARLDSLTGVQRLRLRDGIWAAAEGVIYEEFRPAIHVIDRFEVPAAWPKYWSIDFGYVHPFVWQDWTEEPDGRLILVREIFMTGRMVEDHARQMRALMGLGPIDTLTGRAQSYDGPGVTGWEAKRPQFIVCDHDAEDRATLTRHLGLSTIAANKNVKDGLNASMARYRLDGRGRPRIGFMRDAVVERDRELIEARKPASTVQEIPGYIWNSKGKDEPVKLEDDGCDAMRYLIMERDVQPRPRIRWVR